MVVEVVEVGRACFVVKIIPLGPRRGFVSSGLGSRRLTISLQLWLAFSPHTQSYKQADD